MTREQWLNDIAQSMKPWFVELGCQLGEFRTSIGFPSTGRRSKRVGECWYAPSTRDGYHEIFISPTIFDSERIAGILAHELVHVAAGQEAKHGPQFKEIALAIGLEGPMRATKEGELFKERFQPILEVHGPFPGGGITGQDSRPRQTTRMIKCTCQECGYTVRTTRKWIDEAGPPICPTHAEAMEVS